MAGAEELLFSTVISPAAFAASLFRGFALHKCQESLLKRNGKVKRKEAEGRGACIV